MEEIERKDEMQANQSPLRTVPIRYRPTARDRVQLLRGVLEQMSEVCAR